MFAETNAELLEPNVLYIDEKPPKIVQTKKKTTKKGGERAKKMAKKKRKAGPCRNTRTKAIKTNKMSKSKQRIKKELTSSNMSIEMRDSSLGADPLYTSDKEIKMEIDIVESGGDELTEAPNGNYGSKLEIKYQTDSEDQATKDDFSVDDEEEEYEPKFEPDDEEEDEDEEEGEDEEGESEQFKDYLEDYEDDEPLIKLARKKGRPRKYAPKYEDVNKTPGLAECRHICKQKCTLKFSEKQRRFMCDTFWSLSEEDKVVFIRKHTKTKRYKRLKRNKTKSRGSNYCYYLDEPNASESDIENGGHGELALTRVCRKYFESTLCLTNYTIKKALDGYTPEIERDIKSITASEEVSKQNDNKNKSKEESGVIQQYLDPETGNLITIDPKAEKRKNSGTASDGCKRKRKPARKPGDPLPEHFPKPIKCAERCIHKCHTKFTEEERKQICDIFWSMDYNRRKDFILARIETREVETERAPEFRLSNRPPRTYHTRFFLRSGKTGENIRVCKHFMMATLAITRNFIKNAIEFVDKNTGCYTGLDRRGLNSTPKRISADRLQIIKDQIASFPSWIPHKKSKTRYLHHSLSIKRMYTHYKEMCIAQQNKFVSTNIYYKSFHEDFRLSFLSNPEPKRGGGFLKANPNVSHYTGEEPGGIWLDPKGEKLDLSLYDPAQSFISYTRLPSPPQQQQQQEQSTPPSSVHEQTGFLSPDNSIHSTVLPQQTLAQTAAAASSSSSSFAFNQPAFNYAHLIDPGLISQPTMATAAMQHEFNLNLYENSNLPHPAHAASSSSLFRKL